MKNFIVFLLLSAPLFGQARPPVNQASVFDIKGAAEVQYRPVVTPIWNPLTSGMSLGERTLIRLNHPESEVTLQFSDGSFVRLFGLGSFYLDRLNRVTNNVRYTRLFLLTGRWFYSSNPLEPARFIVNSDITTSIIENGSGGGFFYKGRSEMLVRSGRGLFGWRQTNASPVVLEANQLLNFDINNGFSKNIEAATLSNYVEYGLFAPESPTALGRLSHWAPKLFSQNKAAITSNQIDFAGLHALEQLNFVRKEDALAVGIARTVTNVTLAPAQEAPVLPKAIPLSLLKPIQLADFEVAPPPSPVQLVRQEEPAPPPVAAAMPRVRQVRQTQLQEEATLRNAAPVPAPVNINLAAATAGIVSAEPAAQPVPRRRAPAPAPRIVAAAEEAAAPVEAETPAQRQPRAAYRAPANFNKDHFTNDPAFQYRKFEVNSAEDLLQGDFARSLFY